MKKCSQCGETKTLDSFFNEPRNRQDGRHAECKECTKAAKKRWAERNKQYTLEYARYRYYNNCEDLKRKAREWKKEVGWRAKKEPQKIAARKAVQYAVKVGNIVRLPCCVCGCEPAEAHHPDYSKKLEVAWLCKRHHGFVHRYENESVRC